MIRLALGLIVLLAAWHVAILHDYVTGLVLLGVLALVLKNSSTILSQFNGVFHPHAS